MGNKNSRRKGDKGDNAHNTTTTVDNNKCANNNTSNVKVSSTNAYHIPEIDTVDPVKLKALHESALKLDSFIIHVLTFGDTNKLLTQLNHINKSFNKLSKNELTWKYSEWNINNHSNGVNHFFSHIDSLKLLRNLYIDGIELNSEQYSLLGNELQYLHSINISNFAHSLNGIQSIKQLTSLKIVDCNNFNRSDIENIVQLNNLTKLKLIGLNNIVDGDIELLTKLNKLTCLTLKRCYKLTDKSLEYVSTISSIEQLDIRDNNLFSDNGIGYLAKLNKLTALATDIFHANKANIKTLQCLRLQSPDDEQIKSVTLIKHLKAIRLSGSSVTPTGILYLINNLPELEAIDVDDCTVVKAAERKARSLFRINSSTSLAESDDNDIHTHSALNTKYQWGRYVPPNEIKQFLSTLATNNNTNNTNPITNNANQYANNTTNTVKSDYSVYYPVPDIETADPVKVAALHGEAFKIDKIISHILLFADAKALLLQLNRVNKKFGLLSINETSWLYSIWECDHNNNIESLLNCNNLKYLRELHCDRVNFTVDQYSLLSKNFTYLHSLQLNQTKSIIGINHLQQLKNLRIESSSINNDDIAGLIQLTNLIQLKLINLNKLIDSHVQQFSSFCALNHLSLKGNSDLTDNSLQFISTINTLKRIDIRELPKITDNGILHLTNLSALNALATDVFHNNMSKITSLQCLRLQKPDDSQLKLIQQLKKLKAIRLAGNSVTPAGILDLINSLPELEAIDVDDCTVIKAAERMSRAQFRINSATSESEESDSHRTFSSLNIKYAFGRTYVPPSEVSSFLSSLGAAQLQQLDKMKS